MEAAAGGNEANRPLATPEEEALKRNTDCVYFLASPLTCKKGVECEYRHSEGARVNPRDCWFWLNGNCLNPKCSFRHPPLDGLIGTATTPSGTAPPPQLAFPTPAYSSATQASNKQNVPCYYFQKGVCLKGDRCSFVHGVPPIANPVLQQNKKVAALATKPSQLVKKTSWSLEKCTAQNIPEETVGQPVAAAISLVRPIARADTALANGTALKNSTHNVQPDVELPSRFERNNVPFGGGNASIRPGNQLHQPESMDNSQNDRDGSECLRESSPGFDVLVDDETEDAEYFHDEEEFKGISSHEGGRSLNAVDEYDSHHNTDYDSFSKLDRYSEIGEYGLQAPVTDRYAREHRRASSERMLERSSGSDRRRTRREENSNEMDGSDLRHRLKQRRLNGSRPAVNSDHHLYRRDDHYAEELRYGAPAHRGDQQHASCKGSMSKRLQGRITLPGRNSADSQGSMRSDREIDRGRNWGKPSPGGPTNHQGRLLDRINWQKQDCFPSDEKKSGTQSIKRDATGTLDFAGPRRLSELKGSKGSSNSEQISVGSNSSTLSREQRDMKLRKALGGHQESELVQFEGPKPLSVILKSKREAAPENVAASSDEEERKDKVDEGPRVTPAAASSPQIYHSSVSEEKGDETLNNTESLDAAALDDEEEEEGMIPVDDGEEQHFQSSEKNVLEMEDDAVEYDMEDPELEGYEHGDEEYYYEENEGEDYKTEDAADTLYVEDDEEVQEADDGDEFEKKLGAMLN